MSGTRPEIYGELYALSDFVKDPEAGSMMKDEAWTVINDLLDQLVELQKVDHGTLS